MSYVVPETLALFGVAAVALAYMTEKDAKAAHEEPLPNKKEKVYTDVKAASSHRGVMPQFRAYTEAGTYMRHIGINKEITAHLNPTYEQRTNDPIHDAVRGDGRHHLSSDDKSHILRSLATTVPGTHAHEYHRAAVGAALVQHAKGDRRPVYKTHRVPVFTSAY